jgi:hypothetical protein
MSRPCGGKGGFDDYVERWHWKWAINNNKIVYFYAWE